MSDDSSIDDDLKNDNSTVKNVYYDSNESGGNLARNRIRKRKQRRLKVYEESDSDSDSSFENEFNSGSTTHDFWSKHEYAQLYTALKQFEAYGAKICVPEFVFFGLQSSGKTSAISLAARLPMGIMKNGTGSRCPVRFQLKFDTELENPLIRVNDMKVDDEQEMISRVLEHMQKLEKQDKFSTTVLEIRIDWKYAPELTFVDLPGLITNRNAKFKADYEQLQKITGFFLNQKKNGRYQYIPVLVQEAVEQEHSYLNIESLIDEAMDKYSADGGFTEKRSNWRGDAIFIVNKFDKLLNCTSAVDLINNMTEYDNHIGRTVITMLNPNEEMTGNMTYSDLKKFVKRVPMAEKGKWEAVFANFSADDNIQVLKQLCSNMCGVDKMNDIIMESMKETIKSILPEIQLILNQTEHNKIYELEQIAHQIANCDPIRLKCAITKFNNLFLNYLRNFYVGTFAQKLKNIPFSNADCLTWEQELHEFHTFSDVFNMHGYSKSAVHVTSWSKKYERSANTMLELLNHSSNSEWRDSLSYAINMKLTGGSSLKRILDVWSAMVTFMPFPKYTDEDVHRAKHIFNDAKPASIWSCIQAIVLEFIENFVDSCHWLAEMTRFRLKRNADLVFEYAIKEDFGAGNIHQRKAMVSSDMMDVNGDSDGESVHDCTQELSVDLQMRRLLQNGLESYKKVIDEIVDEFAEISQMVPENNAQILEKMFCRYNIDLASFIKYKLSQNKYNDNKGNGTFDDINESEQLSIIEPTNNNLDEIKNEFNEDGKNMESTDINDVSLTALNDMQFDPKIIRSLSHSAWIGIKHLFLCDIQQKFSEGIISVVKQQKWRNDCISNAVQCGIKRKELEECMEKLMSITGIARSVVEALVEKSPIGIPKDIAQMEPDELSAMYGVDRVQLIKLQESKLKELNDFKQVKRETLVQIAKII